MKRAITRIIIHTKVLHSTYCYLLLLSFLISVYKSDATDAFVVSDILMHDFSHADACYVRQWLASLFFCLVVGYQAAFEVQLK